MEFTLALEFTFSSQRQWRYFTYIVDTAGFHQPPYIRGPHSRCYLLISGHSSNKKSEASELMAFFTYIVDTAGLHQPPYIRNPHLGASCSYPDIRQIKNQRQASLPLIFYFPHCLRLHHAHSGAGTGWHCWSVLFDCSYC